MTKANSVVSGQIIDMAESSCTNLGYLLLRLQASSIGQSVSGSPQTIPGYDTSYPDPHNVSNVGLQAQAVVLFSTYLSGEVLNYCQQYVDAAQSVNANCNTCPTSEKCQEVS